MKPKGLVETTIAMSLMNIAGFIFVDPRLGLLEVQYAVFGVIIAITYLVLWHYWNGRNWARILVLLTGIVAILNLISLPLANFLTGTLLIVEAIFGVFMLWWLNTNSVKIYFKRSLEIGAKSD